MNVETPQFRKDIEWRELTTEERTLSNGELSPWKYILLTDVFFKVETGITRQYNCRSGDNTWVVITPDGILMKAGYSWNGNTGAPERVRWFDLFKWIWVWICMLIGSLPHDGIFQYSGAPGFPRHIITLSWTNSLYYAVSDKRLAWAYRTGLAFLSWAFWCRKPNPGDYVESLPLQPA